MHQREVWYKMKRWDFNIWDCNGRLSLTSSVLVHLCVFPAFNHTASFGQLQPGFGTSAPSHLVISVSIASTAWHNSGNFWTCQSLLEPLKVFRIQQHNKWKRHAFTSLLGSSTRYKFPDEPSNIAQPQETRLDNLQRLIINLCQTWEVQFHYSIPDKVYSQEQEVYVCLQDNDRVAMLVSVGKDCGIFCLPGK